MYYLNYTILLKTIYYIKYTLCILHSNDCIQVLTLYRFSQINQMNLYKGLLFVNLVSRLCPIKFEKYINILQINAINWKLIFRACKQVIQIY